MSRSRTRRRASSIRSRWETAWSFSEDGAGGFAIEELLERDSFLTRPASFKGYLRQIVAANVDQLLIVSSWREPEFWSELVDRYLVTADVHELDPVICVHEGRPHSGH